MKYAQRMYGLVPYNISPIQQGIQFGHAVVEYGLMMNRSRADEGYDGIDYQLWAENDKTFIILNGGTTNKSTNQEGPIGTLNQAADKLMQIGIPTARFYEPDLGDQLTAVVFLVDERVYDKEKYEDYCPYREEISEPGYYKKLFGYEWPGILELREFLSQYKLA